MRAIWKGAISFGLVNIPVGLHNATSREEIKFRLLRSSDLSPVNYKRVAEVDGKEVPWGQIVKGYEYEKGKFVVLKDEDFKRVDLEATDTIDIVDFVEAAEIDPMYFYRPYYLEPEKGGAGAYSLLREVLAKTGKLGIAKIVIKTRQHLAAVKADGPLLVLELMHFADELIDRGEFKVPEKKPSAREVAMATALVDQMSENWDPARYTDDYRSALMKLIHQKVESGGKELPSHARHRRAASNVIDLASVLQESLQRAGKSGAAKPAAGKRKRKKAA
ncbi:MAG TPA: Ku protein [Opitutaceae bacterium]|nr:Ku protein [Opitutaceae bacterium]